jgi:hypothetical protein
MNYLSQKLAKALLHPTLPINKKSVSLSPSSASVKIPNSIGGESTVGACLREQFYRIKDFPTGVLEDKNIDWTISALIGDRLHQLISDLIDTHGFSMGLQKISEEHPFYIPQKRISGRCDLIVWDYNKQKPVGIEVKSIGEYKAKKALEQPIEEHVLQAIIYLDYYNKAIPDDQTKIEEWYIWYVSRTENWSIKAKPHDGPFTMLWDYAIKLDNGVPIITTNAGTQRWTNYSIDNIYKRYNELLQHLENNIVPPRDYEMVYSEEKITSLYKADLISTKTNKEAIERWLKKGAEPGKLKVTMGDIECSFCKYSNICWNGATPKEVDVFSNFPSNKKEEVKEKNNNNNNFLL